MRSTPATPESDDEDMPGLVGDSSDEDDYEMPWRVGDSDDDHASPHKGPCCPCGLPFPAR